MVALGVDGLQGFLLPNIILWKINKLQEECLEMPIKMLILMVMKTSRMQGSVVLSVRIFFMSSIIPKKMRDVADQAK